MMKPSVTEVVSHLYKFTPRRWSTGVETTCKFSLFNYFHDPSEMLSKALLLAPVSLIGQALKFPVHKVG